MKIERTTEIETNDIQIDVEDGQEANDEVEPDAEPEPTYS